MRYLLLIGLIVFTQQLFAQSFTKEIPKYPSGKEYHFNTIIRESETELKLDTIANGFDSLQIRVWYFPGKLPYPKEIISIKKQETEWIANYYNRDNGFFKKALPKSGWEKFIQALFSSDILTLPNAYDIPGHKSIKDGVTYCVEVSDQNHYRLYYYFSPETYNKNLKEVREMNRILKLLDSEFGFVAVSK